MDVRITTSKIMHSTKRLILRKLEQSRSRPRTRSVSRSESKRTTRSVSKSRPRSPKLRAVSIEKKLHMTKTSLKQVMDKVSSVVVEPKPEGGVNVVRVNEKPKDAAVKKLIRVAISKNACNDEVNQGWAQDAVDHCPFKLVVMNKAGSKTVPVGFLMAKVKEDSILYIELICSSLGGVGRMMLDYTIEFARVHNINMALSALPAVLGYYPKFHFKHRLSCKSKPVSVATIPTVKDSEAAYSDIDMMEYMMLLADKGFVARKACTGKQFLSSNVKVKKTFIKNECADDGFYMMRCKNDVPR
jgi:hypothetical protein